MAEEIIALLSNKDTISLGIDDISKKLKIKNKKLLQIELNKMVSTGILDFSPKKSKYLLFENSGLYRGRMLLDKYGNGIVKINDKEIKILKRNMNGASYNDLVAIDIDDRNNQGVVARVIEKDDTNYVCTVISINNKLFINDSRLGIFPVNDDRVVEGSVVLIHHYDGNNEIISILGHKDDPGMDIKSIIYDYGFSDEFPLEVLGELDSIPNSLSDQEIDEEISRGRVDYRDKLIFTIDGDDTKDIDDAISIKRLDNGNIELGVYIADVAHYINKNSYLYDEASKRGTSVYPPDSVLPMFPHEISNGICSLNPGVNRFAMAYTTVLDNDGNVLDFKVEEAVIRSAKKMSYSDVNKILSGNDIEDYKGYLKELYLLEKLALLIENRMNKNGYLEFMSDEVIVNLNRDGKVVDVSKREMGIAEKIIEYAMVVTNVELSKYAYYLGLPWIYRNHENPNEKKLFSVIGAMKSNGFLWGNYSNKKISKMELQDILREIKSLDNGLIFSKLLVRCQDEAKYSDDNKGHFALGVDFYSHNTSPIRRAPDLENQMILKDFFVNGLDDIYFRHNDISDKASSYSKQERKAKHCEWDIVDMKKAQYMEKYIGQEVVGTISYVTGYGFYVLLDNMVEGFVRVDELPQGRYNFDENKLALISRKNSYTIGDKIVIHVKRVNVDTGSIEFTTKDYDYEKLDKEKRGKRRIRKK